MKIWDFACVKCDNFFEAMVSDDEVDSVRCDKCGAETEKQLTFGGYVIHGNNSASVRPRAAGSFKRSKDGKSRK